MRSRGSTREAVHGPGGAPARRGHGPARACAASQGPAGAARPRGQGARPALPQSVAAHTRVVPGRDDASRGHGVCDHARARARGTSSCATASSWTAAPPSTSGRRSRCLRPTATRSESAPLRSGGISRRTSRRRSSGSWRDSVTSRSSTWSPPRIIPARRSPTGRRSTISASRAAAASSCPGSTTRVRCRSPCLRPRCTWRRSEAWTSWCCGRRAMRCPTP